MVQFLHSGRAGVWGLIPFKKVSCGYSISILLFILCIRVRNHKIKIIIPLDVFQRDKMTKNQRVKRRTENEVIIEIMALRALVVSYCRTSIVLGFGEHI